MSEKALKKQTARCVKWLQRLGECFAARACAPDVSLAVSAHGAARAAQAGYVVLNGGVLAGCNPHAVVTVLHANGLLCPRAPERVVFYGSTLPFVLVNQPLLRPAGSSVESDEAVSSLTIPPSRSWYEGECLVVPVPQTEGQQREGCSRNAGCGFLFLAPCDFDAVHATFATMFQRHVLCPSAPSPSSSSVCEAAPSAVPRELSCLAFAAIPGLFCVPGFLTKAEEDAILLEVYTHRDSLKLEHLARRSAAHFNRRFIYGTNKLGNVGEDVNPEPQFYRWMRARLCNTDPAVHICAPYPVVPTSTSECDQLTINYYDYRDGQAPGIATHVDAHSPFDEYVYLVSLGSYTVMDFCPWDAPADVAPPMSVLMAPRSLIVLSGAVRYGWTHAIAEKRTDIINEYTDVLVRQDRVSLTWRRGQETVHDRSTCLFPTLCDGV